LTLSENELIRRYLGIPFKHKGRTRDGLDCWGFLKLVFADLGYQIYDPGIDYKKDWGSEGENYFLEHYYLQWKQVSRAERFDVVLLENSKGIANHAGLILSRGRFIHCAVKSGVIVSRFNDFKNRIHGFYRIKNDYN